MQLSSTDYDQWMYFFSIEPAGHIADNWRAGVMTASIVNAVAQLKSHEALKPSDIFPDPHANLYLKSVSAQSMRHFSKQLKSSL